MPFCTNCGAELSHGVKFCNECGTPINSKINEKRKTVYDGEIHKCPSCGEKLKSFVSICPICGEEIRGGKTVNSLTLFFQEMRVAKTEKEKIVLIKTFPLPNYKEDIIEFMLLSSSNFDARYYASHLDEEDISDAWLSKIEQCFEKASLAFGNDVDFEKIETLYLNIKKQIESSKIERSKERKLENKKQRRLEVEAEAKKFRSNRCFKSVFVLVSLLLLMLVIISSITESEVSLKFSIASIIIFVLNLIVIMDIFPIPSKKVYRLLIIILTFVCIAFLVASIFNLKFDSIENFFSDYQETFIWDGTGLCKYLPVPNNDLGQILIDNDNEFKIELYQTSLEDFESYIEQCRLKGFNVDVQQEDKKYSSYNDDNIELLISYNSIKKIINIYLNAKERLINIKYNLIELKGLDCETVVKKIKENGFDNVTVNIVKVPTLSQIDNSVANVTINNQDIDFIKNDRFTRTSNFIVTVYKCNLITTMSSDNIIGKNYIDITVLLKKQGFTNIKHNIINDVILGWFVEKGEIESISINGITEFNSEQQFPYDAEVIISYHQ